MKNTFCLFFIIYLFFTFTSCEENGIFFPTPTITKGTFEVIIDGQLYSTQEASFVRDGNNIFINAIKPNTNEIFTLKVDNFDVGNFSFQGTNTVASFIENNPVSANVWSTSNQTSSRGTIVFTDIDLINNTVSGTFNFIGNNISTGSSRAFTQGTFVNIPQSITSISDDNFSAKVDGIEYQEESLFTNLVTVGSKELILINANKSLSETISINLESDIDVGEYDFGSFISQTYPTGQYNVGSAIYLADGKIRITSHNKIARLISGTFQFDASPATSSTPNFSITEGSFNVSY
ncbi:DUF6252 family protein [Polaribacter porphyrae]|uniref:DUF5689 domain-containing protein n=1 Tax=Polaribacter porphyrae TaxID=1137780 RepID=A0A2S7WSW1_9FLAO|nr:DUF6252 family protein [Polaribacter porphyrae]PQJ80402.1 hypothetical protein BTO18_15010 [Polaribacter porphyrae]